MLRLLLDEQISPDIGQWFHRRHERRIISLAEWEEGRFVGQTDDLILHEAAAQKLTLVTYDRKTIPPLLKTYAEAGRDHGGVIFVDHRTISPADFGGLIRAIQRLFEESSRWQWTNRVCFLRK